MTNTERPRIVIAAARVNAGMNQREMAEFMGVDISTVGNGEKGKSEPTVSQLIKISEVSCRRP